MKAHPRFALKWQSLLILCLLLFMVAGCQREEQPLQPVTSEKSLPLFTDDGDRSSLITAARAHLDYLKELPSGYSRTISDRTVSRHQLIASMERFLAILEETPAALEVNHLIREEFDIYQATGRASGKKWEMLVTGYYEPLFPGSLTKRAPYLYPLYSRPETLVTRNDLGDTTTGRLDTDGTFRPFWTRAEIENRGLLQESELVYLKDPFEAFLLHIQGSGRLKLIDGSQRTVRYAGNNGHEYRSIGKLLVEQGKLALDEVSISTIRHYLARHPDELQPLLQSNPRFIFFSFGDDAPPPGSLGLPLTPGRSIAIDRDTLPDSLFCWIDTSLPVIDSNGKVLRWRPSGRFVLPQDSGAAIEGAGRVDLFMGAGTYAEKAAGEMKQAGRLFLFIAKD